MDAQFTCPHCQQLLNIEEKFFGAQVLCPTCQGPFLALRPGSHQPAGVARAVAPAPSVARPGQPRMPAAPKPSPSINHGPSRPGRSTVSRPVSSPAAAAAITAKEEQKAKLLLISMFAGGVALLAGLLYLGSRFLDKTREETSTLAEVNAITQTRARAEDERRAQQEKEVQGERDKQRTEEVGRITKLLSLNVCDGDDQVAGELAKELVGIMDELNKTFEEGNPPENLPVFLEQRLMNRMTENATLRRWFGKRSPQSFAHAVAGMVFDLPKPPPPPRETPAIRSEPAKAVKSRPVITPVFPPQPPSYIQVEPPPKPPNIPIPVTNVPPPPPIPPGAGRVPPRQ